MTYLSAYYNTVVIKRILLWQKQQDYALGSKLDNIMSIKSWQYYVLIW